MSAMDTLRSVLMRMQAPAQHIATDEAGGFHDVGPDGKFAGTATFVTAGLPAVTPEELDDLMELAGIVPTQIVPLGTCGTCRHARPDETPRGYSPPCSSCRHPRLNNFHLWDGVEERSDDNMCQCGLCRVAVRIGMRRKR